MRLQLHTQQEMKCLHRTIRSQRWRIWTNNFFVRNGCDSDFANRSFTGVTLTARGALIYNSTDARKAVAVLDFGADKTATSGTFTIQFPNFTRAAAILRIA